MTNVTAPRRPTSEGPDRPTYGGAMAFVSTLDDLSRAALERVALEYMLTGMLLNRGMLPQVILHGGSADDMDQVAIDLWMGASPNYTRRLRDLMGIDGDDVVAIFKALQLDVGFVHQYMDVEYTVHDAAHAEFRLLHCGALLDAEPHGEDRVFGMCHTIEDPTFDATALAHNPRARIRPIHRPPRQPANRHPHCHWTLTIDPANDPVGPARLTETVGAMPLADVANTIGLRTDDGLVDYRGPFVPALRLSAFSHSALAALAREFQMQTQLLAVAGELALNRYFAPPDAHAMTVRAWWSSGWIMSERLTQALHLTPDSTGMAQLLALHPAIPDGFHRDITIDADTVTMRLHTDVPGLFDVGHPGVPGIVADDDPLPWARLVQGLDRGATADVDLGPDGLTVRITVGADPVAAELPEPDEIVFMRIGSVAGWAFSATA